MRKNATADEIRKIARRARELADSTHRGQNDEFNRGRRDAFQMLAEEATARAKHLDKERP